VISSPAFDREFGQRRWPDTFTPDDEIGMMIPAVGRKMSRPRTRAILDANGNGHECIVEAFTQTHQVFVLICSVATLSRKVIVLA
jgi:hypothetical protein